jgi:hypothetical protein
MWDFSRAFRFDGVSIMTSRSTEHFFRKKRDRGSDKSFVRLQKWRVQAHGFVATGTAPSHEQDRETMDEIVLRNIAHESCDTIMGSSVGGFSFAVLATAYWRGSAFLD